MKSDIEIARETPLQKICGVVSSMGIPEEYLEEYGAYKGKIDYRILKDAALPSPRAHGAHYPRRGQAGEFSERRRFWRGGGHDGSP
ncbi:MAG: formate--tetrahydrofolate ligase [Treponema sp.]|jgi:hypothetical protein|nr:formate--tetrahydrofolate ligase [Treponema sp.]